MLRLSFFAPFTSRLDSTLVYNAECVCVSLQSNNPAFSVRFACGKILDEDEKMKNTPEISNYADFLSKEFRIQI